MSLLRKYCKQYGVGYARRILRSILDSGVGIFWIILTIIAVAIVIALIVGLAAGIIVGIPSLLLWLAWNWVVPVFGGPAIGFWTAVGIFILVAIVSGLVHK